MRRYRCRRVSIAGQRSAAIISALFGLHLSQSVQPVFTHRTSVYYNCQRLLFHIRQHIAMQQELRANGLLADDLAKHFIRRLKRLPVHILERAERHGLCASQRAISCAAASLSKQATYRTGNSPQTCRRHLSNIVHIRHVYGSRYADPTIVHENPKEIARKIPSASSYYRQTGIVIMTKQSISSYLKTPARASAEPLHALRRRRYK